MGSAFLRLVTEVCAIPPPPKAARAGTVVHPAAAYLRYRLCLWLLGRLLLAAALATPLVSIEVAAALGSKPPPAVMLTIVRVLEWIVGITWLLSLPIGVALQRLDYEQRWYVITDRSLRIREGVLVIHDMTLTYANVQNVVVQQGPLQRAFGIADVRVQTAGGGAVEQPGQRSMHVGHLRGLQDAARIQAMVVARMKKDGAGLGDPDDAHTGAQGSLGSHGAGPDAAAPDTAATLRLLVQTAHEARVAAQALVAAGTKGPPGQRTPQTPA